MPSEQPRATRQLKQQQQEQQELQQQQELPHFEIYLTERSNAATPVFTSAASPQLLALQHLQESKMLVLDNTTVKFPESTVSVTLFVYLCLIRIFSCVVVVSCHPLDVIVSFSLAFFLLFMYTLHFVVAVVLMSSITRHCLFLTCFFFNFVIMQDGENSGGKAVSLDFTMRVSFTARAFANESPEELTQQESGAFLLL